MGTEWGGGLTVGVGGGVGQGRGLEEKVGQL